MNREILRLALPNIVSNITVPVMGIASTMIAGNLGGGDTTRAIGSLAVGVSIFNFTYWNCSFLRMGTSGLTAQAYGAKNHRECTATLARTLLVAAVLGALILLLQYPLGQTAIWAMNGDELVAEYFYARIWAVPAGIMLFGLNGWFIGMQNARIPCGSPFCKTSSMSAVRGSSPSAAGWASPASVTARSSPSTSAWRWPPC